MIALAVRLVGAVALLSGCSVTSGRPPAQLSPAAQAAPSRFGLVDSWALSTPESEAGTIRSLARFLAQPEFSEEEKARAVFRWVAANLRYDLEAFSSGAFENLPPEEVLRRRAAVCDGYAGLFEALARSAGMDAVTIRGYAKGAGYFAGKPVGNQLNHAWNAVLASGRWRLLDCTWAAGTLTEGDLYDPSFDPYFFDVPPEEFVLTHFPADPRWQLREPPMSREEFESLPYVKTSFFKCGLRLGRPKTWKVEAEGPLVRVSLGAPSGTSLLASLLQGEEEMREGRITIVREEGGAVIWALAPRPGEFTLRVFATRGAPQGPHQWVLDYVVEARAGQPSGTVEEALAKAGVRVPEKKARKRT